MTNGLYKRCDCADQTKCWHPWSYRFVLHGRRYRKSTKTANRQSAERIYTKARANALEGKEGIAAPITSPRLSSLIDDYKAAAKEEHRTFNKDERVLDAFLDFIKDRPSDQVTTFAIDKWKITRAKSVAQSTVNRELNVVKALFSRAVAWKKLKVSPAVGVEPFEVDDVRIRVLDDSELATVLGAPHPLGLIFSVTLECLIRLSEVLGLRKEHIGNGAVPFLEVRRKGGAVDRIAITSELRDALLANCHKSGFVFGESDGKPPAQECASLRVTRYMRSVGLVGVSHHTMRHTGITLMLERGVNPRVIQRLAGWSSLRMLERYGHVRDAEMLRAVSSNRAHLQEVVVASTAAREEAK